MVLGVFRVPAAITLSGCIEVSAAITLSGSTGQRAAAGRAARVCTARSVMTPELGS
jgi:hypothetical protein